jgi:hypothetical protein
MRVVVGHYEEIKSQNSAGSISMAVGEFVSMTQKAEMEKAQGIEDDGEVSDPWTAALTSWVRFSTCTARLFEVKICEPVRGAATQHMPSQLCVQDMYPVVLMYESSDRSTQCDLLE